MLNIISWNVQSLRNFRRRGVVKRWIAVHKPDLIVFQETLVETFSDSIVSQIWGGKANSWLALDSIGRSCGILIIWNPNKLEMLNHIIGTFSININFKNSIDNFNWLFSGVYGPCEVEERKRLWDELSLMQTIRCLPWCIGGDFNEVRIMSERKACTRITSGMKDFGTFYEENELIDLPIAGAKYTWIKKGSNTPRSKIDRFVVNAEGMITFFLLLLRLLEDNFRITNPYGFLVIWRTGDHLLGDYIHVAFGTKFHGSYATMVGFSC